MLVIVEVTSVCGVSKRVWLRPGEQIVVGSTERSDLVLACDRQLAERHFTIGWDNASCHVRSLAADAETTLNGNKVGDAVEAVVRDQDVIVAGSSKFHISIDGVPVAQPSEATSAKTADETIGIENEPTPCLHRVGSWGFDCIPDQWEPIDGLGLQWQAPEHEPGVVSVSEGELAEFVDFRRYVQLLLTRLVQPALGLEPAAPSVIRILGADDALECSVRFTGPKGQSLVQRQVFARSGNLLGTAAFMTQETCVSRLNDAFQQIREGMSFQRGRNGERSIRRS